MRNIATILLALLLLPCLTSFAQETSSDFKVSYGVSKKTNYGQYTAAHVAYNKAEVEEIEEAGFSYDNLEHFQDKMTEAIEAKGYVIDTSSNLEIKFFITLKDYYGGKEVIRLFGSDVLDYSEAPDHIADNISETDGTVLVQAREKDTDKLVWFASTKIHFDKESKDFQDHSKERIELIVNTLMEKFPIAWKD